MDSLTILITNYELRYFAGTELVVRDLALCLKQLGHYPMVYAPEIGEIAHPLIAAGIPVVNDLALLPQKPDIIHGHHHIPTMQALLYFNDVPGIYVCHDRLSKVDFPPFYNQIAFYVAVSYLTLERLLHDALIPKEKTQIITNTVDIQRFKLRDRLPQKPQRALFFSSYPSSWRQLQPFSEACKECGISFDAVGYGLGNGITEPENILGNYDIVFAVGKCALEALAVGCAVIPALARSQLIGKMISTQNVKEYQLRNFAQCMEYISTKELIIEQIRQYDASEASNVSEFIRTNASLSQSVQAYLTLYQRVISTWQNKRNPDSLMDYMDHQITLLNDYSQRQIPRDERFGINKLRPLDRHINLINLKRTIKKRFKFLYVIFHAMKGYLNYPSSVWGK